MSNDKILHVLCCFCIVLIFGVTLDVATGILLAITISVSKEVYDQYKYKGWDWNDILADLFGIIIGILCLVSFFG